MGRVLSSRTAAPLGGAPTAPAAPLNNTPATSVLALTVGWWRPVLWYPLVTAWNLVLYIGDVWHAAGQVRLLRWNSAFWDE